MDRNEDFDTVLFPSNCLGKRVKWLTRRRTSKSTEASSSRLSGDNQEVNPATSMDVEPIDTAAAEVVLSNEDLLKSILHYLDVQDLCTVATVCKLWQTISDADEFWTSIAFDKRSITRDQVLMLCERHRNIRRLSLRGVALGYGDEAFFSELLPRLDLLQMLEIAKELLTDGVLSLISERLPALRSLVLCDVTVGRYGPGEASLSHPTLTSASFLNCRTGRLKVQCNALTSLCLRGSHITVLAATCPTLSSLDMTGCSKISDVNLRTSIIKLSSLASLNLEANLPLSDDTLREFASHLTRLTELNVSSCMGLSLNGVRDFPVLRVLHMNCCEGLAPSTAVPALESFAMLEELYVDNCGLLTQLELSMPRLRVVSLRSCRSLTRLDLRCRCLQQLLLGPVSNCSLGCNALRHVTLVSDAMRKLTWNAFPALESLTLDCATLTELSFFDCDALKDTVLDGISDSCRIAAGPSLHTYCSRTGGCPNLEVLRMEACSGLRAVTLRHSRLKVLTLGSCKALTSLVVACPLLASVSLDDVTELELLTLGPCSVGNLTLGACSNLTGLNLTAKQLASLDLKGCGRLCQLQLSCPQLRSLDASFCSALMDAALGAALRACAPPLERLVLSVCCQVGVTGLAGFSALHHIRMLDLSYTEISDLDAVFQCCALLESLNIASCHKLRPDALDALLLAPGAAMEEQLPHLKELDVSYCRLPGATIAALLQQGTRFEALALNGCDGMTVDVWTSLNWPLGGDPSVPGPNCLPHRLSSLSLVKCSNLKALFLGLLPSSGDIRILSPRPYSYAVTDSGATAGMILLASMSDDGPEGWLPAATPLMELRTLRLNLSGIQVLALALPSLTLLDLNSCFSLRQLELHCPLLLTLFMQACRGLSRPVF